MKATLIYPHQLFFDRIFKKSEIYYLIEDPLFFTQYKFHKQKLIFHRASMKAYAAEASSTGATIRYIDALELSDSGLIAKILNKDKILDVTFTALDDFWLDKRVKNSLNAAKIKFTELPNPHFLTSLETIQSYKPKKDFFYFHDFYISQRKSLNILVKGGKPEGGKWSFDSENREKLPQSIQLPKQLKIKETIHTKEALKYVEANFSTNPGLHSSALYPTTRAEAIAWMEDFFQNKYSNFGRYEDAISQKESLLFHSLFTPLLNVGLISPKEVVERALIAEAPLNSKEGFIRQIIGWREFIRLIYLRYGSKQRTGNYLNNQRPLSKKFYDGSTGILPFDNSVKRVMESGYCHHIERLMILGNFMLLCDIHPDSVYQWFMELFIDSYDWVMVPNVYGMSQYADGGLMTTKPYISGSNYVIKMSDFKKAPWCEVWDALYWRFIDNNYDLIRKNPRMSVMAGMRDKLQASGSLSARLKVAEKFLSSL